ncbi:MAG: hypothetical protein Q8P35_00935 [Candidatus Yanofskybacteria bacterium]|nr:hypothetical protein [Candidatus Yanofskybacteria bacterium]
MNPALNKAPMIPFAAISNIKTMDISLIKIGTTCRDHLAAASAF